MSTIEERSRAFVVAQTDVQMAYIEAERKVTELERKNAKLRKDRERVFQASTEKNAEIIRLLVENEKLRELVLDMLRTLEPPALRVDEIECGTIYAAHIHAFEDRMHELGIEVTE